MKQSRWIYVLVTVVFCAGLGLVGHSFYKIYTRQALVTPDGGEVSEELRRVRSQDLEALQNETGTEAQIAKSILRYSSQNLPQSEEMIKKYLDSDSEVLQAAAIEASGAFPWADIKKFSEALSSKSRILKLAALRGMAKRSDAQRILLIESYGSNKNLSDEEWFFAQWTAIKLNSDPAKKERLRSRIVARWSDWPQPLREVARRELYRALPRDEEMKKVAREELTQSEVSDSLTSALQYLSGYDRQWLKAEFFHFPFRNDHVYQLAMIDFMALACPKNWSAVEKKLRAHPNGMDIVQHLDEAQLSMKCKMGIQ